MYSGGIILDSCLLDNESIGEKSTLCELLSIIKVINRRDAEARRKSFVLLNESVGAALAAKNTTDSWSFAAKAAPTVLLKNIRFSPRLSVSAVKYF
jgi:hypothetical protein